MKINQARPRTAVYCSSLFGACRNPRGAAGRSAMTVSVDAFKSWFEPIWAMRTLPAVVALSTLGVTALACPARADYALVVGVCTYPNLGLKYNLMGSVNDARAMSGVLQADGYKVKSLTEAAATKEGIYAAFVEAAKAVKPGERFVFYFAGHGTNKPKAILPSDAHLRAVKGTGDGGAISRVELKTWLAAIKAGERTVILDSCFSGGMRADPPGVLSRYVSLDPDTGASSDRSVPEPDEVDPKGTDVADENTSVPGEAGRKPVRYISAADNQQKAKELAKYPDGAHGIFTFYLASEMKRKPDASAGPTLRVISQQVDRDSVWTQRPVQANTTDSEPVLGRKPDPTLSAPEPAEKTESVHFNDMSLWDSFYVANVNPDFIQLGVAQQKRAFAKDEPVVLTVDVKETAYILVFARAANGELSLIFPASGNLDACKKFAGHDEMVFDGTWDGGPPQAFKVVAIRANTETSKDLVREYLDRFFPNGQKDSASFTESGAKDVKIRARGDFRIITSGFTIETAGDVKAGGIK